MTAHNLVFLTETLLAWNDRTLEKMQEQTETSNVDFFAEIKPFVEQIDIALEEWKDAALTWIVQEKPRYIHRLQVEQTYENLKQNALQCFASQVKKKRFKETHQAVAYVLHRILDELQGSKQL
ncbi:YppE family protein [Microbacteriaceae bacterium 4G12]